MKNPKNFDYDKQKPNNTKQYIIQKELESNNDDINKIFNEPPLIKAIEVKQGPPSKLKKANKSVSKTTIGKNKMKINDSKLSFKKTVDKKEKIQNLDDISNISEIKNSKNIIKDIDSQKDDIGIIIPTLPESEIIEPDEPLIEEEKVPNPSFCKNYISNLLNPIKLEIDPSILNGVEMGLNKILTTVKDDMEDNKLEINPEQKNVNEIAKLNTNNASLIPKYPTANFEASIKMQKIKELSQRKKRIEKQINQIDENIRLIDEEKTYNYGGGGSLDYPNSVIEENIKKDQIKENKQTKELLLAKLNGINEQVQKLMENEEEIANMKKLNIKDFLENFEKNKEKSEELAKKYDEEKRLREQKMMNSVMKSSDRKQREYEQMMLEEEERKKRELEKTRLKELERIRGRTKENLDKLNYIRQHVNDKPANVNEYLFKALENKYKEKANNEIKVEILKHKEKMKENSVSLEEIFDFEKKQKELELKRLAEIEEEKKKLKEQWKQTKENLPKFESTLTQKLKEEENQKKEKFELEQYKKKSKKKEIKNYSQTVQKLFLPKINENIKKERENRIKSLKTKDNIKKIQRKKKQW